MQWNWRSRKGHIVNELGDMSKDCCNAIDFSHKIGYHSWRWPWYVYTKCNVRSSLCRIYSANMVENCRREEQPVPKSWVGKKCSSLTRMHRLITGDRSRSNLFGRWTCMIFHWAIHWDRLKFASSYREMEKVENRFDTSHWQPYI